MVQIAELRRIADFGLELLEDDPARAKRLQRMRDYYVFMEKELPPVIDKWLASDKAQDG